MFYTIYKTTNIINEKYYIGKHQTKNPQDSYLGSGKALREALKLYGKESFTKEILYVFETEAEMNEMERRVVSEKVVNDPRSYNMTIGGEGGAHFKGKRHTPETIQKVIQSRKGYVASAETRQKLSDANRLRAKPSEQTKNKIAEKARARGPRSEETRAKIAATLKMRNKDVDTGVKLIDK